MEFNPNVDQPMVDAYPEIKKFPKLYAATEEFDLHDMDIMLRFVVKYFDIKQKVPIEGRQEQVMRELKVPPRVREAISVGAPTYTDMVVEYFEMLCSYEFEEWVSKRELYHHWTSILRTKTIDDKMLTLQIKIESSLSTLLRSIAELEHRIFPDKSTARLVAGFKKQSDLSGYPEKYARDPFKELSEK